MQKNIGLFLISLVCIAAVLITGCTNSGSSPAPVTTPAPTTAASITTQVAPVETAAPASVVTTIAATITTTATTASAMNDKISVTLNSAKKRTTNYAGVMLKDGFILLELDITIQNNDKDNDFEYTDSSFVISSGESEPSQTAMTTLSAKGLINPFIGAAIPSGSKKDGRIVFKVKETSNNYKLSVVDSTGTALTSISNINVP